jgi:hypothetical protein
MQQIPARLADIDPQQPIVALSRHGMRRRQVVVSVVPGVPVY